MLTPTYYGSGEASEYMDYTLSYDATILMTPIKSLWIKDCIAS